MKKLISKILIAVLFFTSVVFQFGMNPREAYAAAVELYSTPLFSDANLQSYYRMEGNSNDSKGSVHGTDTSITYNASYGKFGQGASFNGTSSFINLGTSVFNYTELSITFWLPNKGTDKTAYIFARSKNQDIWAYLGIVWVSSYLYLSTNITGSQKRVMPYSSVSNGDHFVFNLKSDGTAQVYRNGSLITPTDTLSGFDAWNNNITESTSLGRAGAFNNYYFDGYLDDVAVFNRLLTSTEISNLYNGTWPASATPTFMFFD